MLVKTGSNIVFKIDDLKIIREIFKGYVQIIIPKMNWISCIDDAIIDRINVKIYVIDFLLDEFGLGCEERHIFNEFNSKIKNKELILYFPLFIESCKREYLFDDILFNYSVRLEMEIKFNTIETLVISDNHIEECNFNFDIIDIELEKYLTTEKLFENNCRSTFEYVMKALSIRNKK